MENFVVSQSIPKLKARKNHICFKKKSFYGQCAPKNNSLTKNEF